MPTPEELARAKELRIAEQENWLKLKAEGDEIAAQQEVAKMRRRSTGLYGQRNGRRPGGLLAQMRRNGTLG